MGTQLGSGDFSLCELIETLTFNEHKGFMNIQDLCFCFHWCYWTVTVMLFSLKLVVIGKADTASLL